SATLNISGVYASAARIRSLNVGDGRFFNEEDGLRRARVAVLGSEAKNKLFSGQYAIGQSIRINGLSFEVVGVLAPKMQEEGSDGDGNKGVFIPFTVMGDLKDTHYIEAVWLDYEGDHTKVVKGVRSTLAAVHGFKVDDPPPVLVFELV